MPQLQPLSHFTPDEPNGGRQSLHGAQRLVFITLHSDENLRRAGIFCQCDLAHAYQPDPRIAELTLDNGLNLLAQGLSQTLAMIFLPAPLHDRSPASNGCEYTNNDTSEF